MRIPFPFQLSSTGKATSLDESLTYHAPSTLTGTVGGTTVGPMPSGTMKIELVNSLNFPGSPGTATIQIVYNIPSGTQLSYHDNPGHSFKGTTRVAYLPDNNDGRMLLTRWKNAWNQGLTFTIGTSMTTGQSDVVTWSTIPHKTSLRGGLFGWPDPNFFADCNEVLDWLQVPSGPTVSSARRPQQATPSIGNQDNHLEETIFYSAPAMIWMDAALCGAFQKPSGAVDGDCSICLDPLFLDNSVQIHDCGHTFHPSCLRDCLNHELKCALCRKPIGEPQGKCPSGSMKIELTRKVCPGFVPAKAIEITYHIPSGTQLSYHENPGHRHYGTTRKAYLPNSDEGRRLLGRLKYAWKHGLTFTVGTSLTSGRHNVITWTSIHHRTSLQGGPYGFPDANYIANCNGSLDALHVPRAM